MEAKMSDDAPITYRLRGPRASESELGFIVKSWLRSLSDSRSQMEKACGYWDAQKLAIAYLLQESRVVIACGADDADRIYGFGVGSTDSDDFPGVVIHWVYVKHEARKRGIGAAIARELGADIHTEPGQAGFATITACTSGWIRARARHLCWGISEFAPLYAAINYNARKAG
jgi:GNAT superfamily N-acetyltransferase